MKVTIAVPSYNYARFIGKCLGSILAQGHGDFEVLVCDGGSTDGTLAIIHEFVTLDRRICLLSTEDKGQSDAIDKAFKAGTGEIFCYLNADDVFLAPNALALATETFSRDPALGVVSFRSEFIDAEDRKLGLVDDRIHPLDKLSWIKYRGQIVQPSAFWRREVYLACPFRTDWHYCFDSAFFYAAYQKFPFLERPEVVSGYRLHGLNKSTGISWKRINELSEFEASKFGRSSARAAYLRLIARMARRAGTVPGISRFVLRALRVSVNSISLLTAHRLPNI